MRTADATQQSLPYEAPHVAMRGELRDYEALRRFITAGNATLTVRSSSTGTRYTYKFKLPREAHTPGPKPVFVYLLTGANNDSDYAFLGTLFQDAVGPWYVYRHSPKSRVSQTTASVQGVKWLAMHLYKDGAAKLFTRAQFWHEGRCGRCGRKLTVPESISSGFGPECVQLIGGAA